ncbi:putative pentatricopeptide repeat-containing protein [Platanthera zijinensis]|uniref:Pentatricopeptide repeat-containing protein n=1 Tax=Platanthera zijinensis TaxID=2320716 RepID=A0AAP0BUB8_9ASPA
MLSAFCYPPWPRFLLSAINNSRAIAQAHALMILTGEVAGDNSPGNLIAAYGRSGNLHAARQLFHSLPQPTISSWNAIITAHSRNDSPFEILRLYRRMVSVGGAKPDSSTFTVALKACAQLSDLESGEQIRSHAANLGFQNDVFVNSSLLNLYAKCGKMVDALQLFDKMPKRDLVSWTTMITGFSSAGKPLAAIDFYIRMQSEGVQGDGIAMVGLLQACAVIGHARMGLSIHGHIIRLDMRMDVVVETSLVHMYAKSGHLSLANRIFSRMRHKNVVSWSALISAHAQNGFANEALFMLVKMQDSGIQPDSASLVSGLLACSQIGFLKLGKSFHGFLIRRRLNVDDVKLGTAVIDMYSKCGCLLNARTLFNVLSLRDSIAWNAMISCYGIHGNGVEALSLFLKMKEANLKPDDATFASLMSALSHSGLVDEGRQSFNCMLNEFRIEPGEKHYASMVDLLARAGHAEEALDLIRTMTDEPGVAIWVALLSGCLNHKKFIIGEYAAEKVLKLNPDDLGVYALVSNLYASARNWDRVSEIRRVMKKMGMKKTPGHSLVELDGKLHAFLVEDISHPEHVKIVAVLKRLEYEMRKLGYIPKIELVLT